MKFETLPTFDRDWHRLPREHRKQFREVVRAFSVACDEYVANSGREPWPASLRVSRMHGHAHVWEMTWSFASPDGRATFEFIEAGGEARVLWRRIGDHSIYKRP